MNTQVSQIKSSIPACSACSLRKEARLPVPFDVVDDGNEKILIIGINPGDVEDAQGKPFVGDSGVVLGKVWEQSGFKRSDFWITNLVKCHSIKNRPPTEREISICSARFLDREKNIARSRLVITLGHLVSSHVIGVPFQNEQITPGTIGRGDNKKGAFYCSIYHPSYIVRDNTKYPAYLETWKGIKKFWDKLNAPPEVPVEDKDFISGAPPVLNKLVEKVQKIEGTGN